MTMKMRPVCIAFALLAVAFSGFVVGNVVPLKQEATALGGNQSTQLPLVNSTDNNSTTTAQPLSSIAPAITSNTPNTTATTSKPKPTTGPPTSTTIITTSSSTVVPTTPVVPTTNATTHAPATTTATPSTQPSTPNTTSHPTSTAVPHSTVTVPSPTAAPTDAPSPSKERHFDGLSFIGGIILTTCLMGIAAFTWKFYRTCNEGNYRTL